MDFLNLVIGIQKYQIIIYGTFDFFFFFLFAKVGGDNVSSNYKIDKSCQLLDIPCSTMMEELEARFNS